MNPILSNYADFVQSRVKPASKLLAEKTELKVHLDHMAVGIAGECGELLDALKNFTVYNNPLDVENVLEECSDALFYIVGTLNSLGLTLEQAIYYNIGKLEARYPTPPKVDLDAPVVTSEYPATAYSDELAAARLDKVTPNS
jgi:NTP pyrophosphatase (non-canonical NTP hydrolase)